MAFNSYSEFVGRGMEAICLDAPSASTDCHICTDPLIVNTPTDRHPPNFHEAVRVGVCGHVYGKVCLIEWLKTGNSCPICKRVLFPKLDDEPISEADVDSVIDALRHLFDEATIVHAVLRVIERLDEDWRQHWVRVVMEEEDRNEQSEGNLMTQEQEEFMNDDDWFIQESDDEGEEVEGYEDDEDLDEDLNEGDENDEDLDDGEDDLAQISE